MYAYILKVIFVPRRTKFKGDLEIVSVRTSVRTSVCTYVRMSVRPSHSFPDDILKSAAWIAMKFYMCVLLLMVRCPIDFQGHRSNFKVAEVESLPILAQFHCFRISSKSLHALHLNFIEAFY